MPWVQMCGHEPLASAIIIIIIVMLNLKQRLSISRQPIHHAHPRRSRNNFWRWRNAMDVFDKKYRNHLKSAVTKISAFSFTTKCKSELSATVLCLLWDID